MGVRGPHRWAAFRREVGALRQELETVDAANKMKRPPHAATIESLGDRWDQRRRLLGTIFESMTMKDGALLAAKPKPDWVGYLEEVTGLPRATWPTWGAGGALARTSPTPHCA